jgi:hypothetical protein
MRIHLAGCEGDCFAKVAGLAGAKHVLFSYFHYQKNAPKAGQSVLSTFNQYDQNVICDSGLFTFMFGAGKGGSYDLAFMKDYAAKYIAQAKTYGLKHLTIVECDVHKLLGMPAVFELRKTFEDSGLDVIYVWHREEGIEGLLRLADRASYLAISVPELRILFKGKPERYQKAVFDLLARINQSRAGRLLPRIHLLGNTIDETMRTTLGYSCDSTSWESGVRYGNAVLFHEGRLVNAAVDSEAFTAAMGVALEELPGKGSEIDAITASGKFRAYLKVLYACARAYVRYQAWLDRNYSWGGSNAGKR